MDEGNEFINHHFKGFCRRQNINLFHVNSDKKACVVERFTRTLKDKMWRSFTDRNKHKYIDTLDDLTLDDLQQYITQVNKYKASSFKC